MSGKKILFWAVGLIAAAALVTGCAEALKESGGDQTGIGDGVEATATYVGLENCFQCHGQTFFVPWLESRHANVNNDPAPAAYFESGCFPCHMGPDRSGDALTRNWDGLLFPYPKIGTAKRYVVGCEACHGGGSLHYGIGPFPYPEPAYAQCTDCHAAPGSAHSDHHDFRSTHAWYNQSDVVLAEADAFNALSSEEQAAVIYSYVDPSTGLKEWRIDTELLNDGSNWRFEPGETIRDTHFGEIWITEEVGEGVNDFPNKVTIFVPPQNDAGALHGNLAYVDLKYTSPNSGVVDSSAPNACTASCHKPHNFDLTVNLEWASGAHRPKLMGPIDFYITNYPAGTYGDNHDIETAVGGPSNWHAVEHDDFRNNGTCNRCHASAGFADQAPGGADAVSYMAAGTFPPGGSFVTCNACHTGDRYPRPENQRLRFSGKIRIFGQTSATGPASAVIDSIADAGKSAMCVYCHQGRSGSAVLVQADIDTPTNRVRNRHDAVAAAILYPGKKMTYEYEGMTYFNNTAHADTLGCVGCHMYQDGETPEGSGGHTFLMASDMGENLAACNDGNCHDGDVDPLDSLMADYDWDEDGDTETVKAEVEGLFNLLITTIQNYPNATTPQISWGERLAVASGQTADAHAKAAAYNYSILYKDGGAWAHNGLYAAQLLTDSINDLRANMDEPLPALNGGDRPGDLIIE